MIRVLRKNCCKSIVKRTLQSRQYKTKFNDGSATKSSFGIGKLVAITTPFIAIGGVFAYAKFDNEFRKKLGETIPGSEYVLKMVLDEKTQFPELKKNVATVATSIKEFVGSDTTKKSEPPKKAESSIPQKSETTKTVTKKEIISQTLPVELVTVSTDEKTPTNLDDLEVAVEVSAKIAVELYNKAIDILKDYNEDIRKVVDEAVDKVNLSSWSILKNKTSTRNTALENAEKGARDAIQIIEKCELALSNIVDDIDHDKLLAVRLKIKTLTDHINHAKNEVYKQKDNSSISEKYWKKVESARNYYVHEIESLFPDLVLSDKKLNLSKDDLDLFLIHAYSHVLAYQKELQRIQVDGELRLKRALDAIRGEDHSESIKTQLEYQLEKEKRKLAIENQKKILKIRTEVEKELRQQLKRQSEAHVDHLHDALSQKETELKRNFSKELDEKLSVEKASYKLQLASMLGKLKGMDAALKARAESERCAHQAQALWAACQALWASVRTGEPGVHWRQKLRPLKSEIKAVNKAAAQGDELVNVILENLPKEVEDRGVYPEDALRERFINVEKIARKFALIPEEGASLPVYLLSYIQYLLIMQPDDPISQDELQNVKFDFSKLDTYDILNRARYYIDRGDLTLTVKYMNLLQGAPRKISNDWLKEARLLLETQQAANTLMAHAAASGLLYL